MWGRRDEMFAGFDSVTFVQCWFVVTICFGFGWVFSVILFYDQNCHNDFR